MGEEKKTSCVEPAGGPLQRPAEATAGATTVGKEEKRVVARVGKEAPDFRARALIGGEFKDVQLSEYRGQWVMVCFYPGDFTFV